MSRVSKFLTKSTIISKRQEFSFYFFILLCIQTPFQYISTINKLEGKKIKNTRMTILSTSHIKFSFLFHVTFFLILSLANSESHQEHSILLKIKLHLQNPSFLSHWNSSNTSYCSWPEIACATGSVTGLTLVSSSITQTIPSFICDLKNLTHVNFSQNLIPGEFPKDLFKCSNLEYLDLSLNNFVGKIPYDIQSLVSLKYLNLGSTNFDGEIPSSIGKLKDLRSLRLQYCLFNETFLFEVIGDLFNLEFFDMSSNSYLPPLKLPLSLTKLKKLNFFIMYGSNLVGEIPESIGDMVALEKLDLSGNKLTGKIPNGLFMLRNLSIVYLYQNSLSGELPSLVEALNLTEVDLAKNNLTGKIPNDFGKLQKLTVLRLHMNKFSGEIPESISHLKSLTEFSVFMNKFSGTLPTDFGLSSKLEYFHTAMNSFKGRLPENLCYHGMLKNLTVYENSLSGELPKSLGNCSTLVELKINNNEFYGKIPDGLWRAKNLVFFMVSHNKFNGELPQNLSSNVSLFDISYNQFYGGIPIGVASWTNVIKFIASKNYLNGSIPLELTALPKLQNLLLDQNQLKGSLPNDIVSWNSLVILNLSQNQLNGEIPISIGHIPALNVLDLSENQFSGEIPSILPRVVFNLSSNHLRGRVPSEFENPAYNRSFLNNSGLCADTPELSLNLCNFGLEKPTKTSHWSIGLIIGLIVVTFLLALFASFMIIKLYKKREHESESSWKLISFQRLSFTELDILSSMTEQNIIGSGGFGTVYRVPVNDLTYVAVKKIMSNRKLRQKLETSFCAEVKILSNIRHRNIVKLLCCISNEDSMMLVYEYLEHSSLDKWLHNKNKSSNMSGSARHLVLDWPKRLHIAIGIAHGLCYMHHDCSPPIVHRDIKTSNILLDSQFNAKVADFGLARSLMKPEEFNTMSAVIGSFGYMAPEYVQTTKINEKIDVFSFGVILLELTTGKEANYGDEHSSLVEWSWRHVVVGSNIEDLLDKDFVEASCLDEMCCIFKLGIMCTSTLPSSRPSMKEVLHLLVRSERGFVFGGRNDVVGEYDVVPFLKNSKLNSRRIDVVDSDSD